MCVVLYWQFWRIPNMIFLLYVLITTAHVESKPVASKSYGGANRIAIQGGECLLCLYVIYMYCIDQVYLLTFWFWGYLNITLTHTWYFLLSLSSPQPSSSPTAKPTPCPTKHPTSYPTSSPTAEVSCFCCSSILSLDFLRIPQHHTYSHMISSALYLYCSRHLAPR